MSEEKKLSAFDFLNSINDTKKDIMTEDNENLYQPYVINRFLSGTMDTLFVANEMNCRPHLDKRLQYDYLRSVVRRKKRFTKWVKPEKFEELEVIKKYYGYNDAKAKEVLSLFTDNDLKELCKNMDLGGINKLR